MKKNYTTPTIFVEKFCVDEYIAACSRTTATFTCDGTFINMFGNKVTSGPLHFLNPESGQIQSIPSFGLCGRKISVDLKDNKYTFYKGKFVDYFDVIICREYVGGNDTYHYHAAPGTDLTPYEANKS